jgi:UDP-N-acetylglucosamine--N-acetylmuramyl-(pentapeptide) pyrophosphoryl-undecaprenol N-acetylglucosamine transferase
VVWAAANRRIPVVLQEQNAYPGFATRRLAGRARQIHLGFPEARRFLSTSGEVLDSGNPIVPPPAVRAPRAEGRQSQGFAPDRPLVLAFGGSQGARAINEAVEGSLTSGTWPADVQLLWQTGAPSYHRLRQLEAPGRVRVAAFLDPMSDAYSTADLVVCRAGAMTLAELCAWGLPALLIPLPGAAANHPVTNARALSDAGAAVLLEQRDLGPASLTDHVVRLLGDPARMAGLATAALRRARPGAAADIARAALRLL